MRAQVVEIMEAFPVVLQLRLADGTLRDFDTTEDCIVRKAAEGSAMSAVTCGAHIDFSMNEDDEITEIVIQDVEHEQYARPTRNARPHVLFSTMREALRPSSHRHICTKNKLAIDSVDHAHWNYELYIHRGDQYWFI